MKKWKLLPRMAVKGIISNGMVYYPYMLASIIAVYTYFVFASILQNDVTAILPHRTYAWMMLELGRFLLTIILFPFLIYAGSFVIKRRKKEFGLYSLLGLEKKHIGLMLFWENLILYGVVTICGILLGVVLSKLFFLLLLKLSHSSLDVEFVFTLKAFQQTTVYIAIVFAANYVAQLWEIGRSRPVELLSGSKKGEKEPRFLFVWSIIGMAALVTGYWLSIRSKVDSMIFIEFFLAVFLIVVGTYLLFTSGSVFFLKCIRNSKEIYYKPTNFITISGMYYRMKKNAAGLSNICIFSTMVLITLICTVIVFLGIEDVSLYEYPYDIVMDFEEGSLTAKQAESKLTELEREYDLKFLRTDLFEIIKLSCTKEDNRFRLTENADTFEDRFGMRVITLADYNKLTDEQEELDGQEVLIHATGADFGFQTLEFMGLERNIKKEVQELYPFPNAGQDAFDTGYTIVVRDEAARDELVRAWAEQNGVEDMEAFLKSGTQKLAVLSEGTEEQKNALVGELALWSQGQAGFKAYKDGVDGRRDALSRHGGLLFIGVIFGLIFFLCLIIIMYYKQISEGYEDRAGFDVMQKVGMSEEEIKKTIHKQILLVFGLPIAGALSHTAAGMFMVRKLLATLNFYDTSLLIGCTVGVGAVFTLVYGISYTTTAKTYYRIVNHTL